jgi:pyridoxine 4-dehydrogenase
MMRILMNRDTRYNRSKSRKMENLEGGEVELSEAEAREIMDAVAGHGVKGGRYTDAPDNVLHLWG